VDSPADQSSMTSASPDSIPIWAFLVPLLAVAALGARQSGLLPVDTAPFLLAYAALLGASVFAAVHHAEVLALRLGEPFGSILLAVAVTVIEVALIVSILLSGTPGSDAVARDTVYAAVMIVLNGVVGACLVLGAQRHREQTFRIDGASATLAVLGTLATLALVMPNFTIAVHGPIYAPAQLVVIGAVSLALYLVFVFVQTVRHREYFLEIAQLPADASPDAHVLPSNRTSVLSLVLLLIALSAVVLFAKILSKPLETAVLAANLPQAFVGVVIAAVVLLPEGLAATKAALANRLQSSMNLALGSAVASIGLTIPTVAVVSLVVDLPLVLGLSQENMVLLVLTLFVSSLTLGTGRTTVLQGAVHLSIFLVFLMLSAVP
jgi:Ca2+:H+ antiporter